MDIEQLSKSQIVLLVLLVSFVTSIATGIVTVSLLAQAPPAITQTVNRVVERTIETVVPSDSQQAASVITTETTVIVKEDELITESIQKSFEKIGRIRSGTATSSPIVGMGVLISNGQVITDLSIADKEEHLISFSGGDFLYTVSAEHKTIGVAVLTPVDERPSVSGFRVGDSNSLKLGQTQIALFGLNNNKVSINSYSAQSVLTEVEVGEKKVSVRLLDTTPEAAFTPGAPLITIFGDLVGISTSVSRTEGNKSSFVSYSDIASIVSPRPQSSTATTTPAN
ncbi:hypothetical protein COU15_02445 [Candidatus Kaiserbacteria bacterium CG10_big_fil_rev_8_21_14_0_10_45_20]|uniref:Serine protease n=1 Tax=Candidatus Kaiserbacteria bacterium CG10_big_fil_rev_8_21_14_0_10_45_20 TaxID=1974607 RepID=A0A2H0UF97_9BACT|nr:MAG: hypothetical protein COU15_02445 [Candidatus Kaiserbacteria bacterium CG10_big_fil_rev_8_21_14_0_10_45_20]